MELDGSAARSGEAWPTLVEPESAERTVSPRALLLRGPVTRAARHRKREPSGSERVLEPELPPIVPPSRQAVLRWRAGVIAVVVAAAAALVVIAREPAPSQHADEQLAAVGAASPETATALAPEGEPAKSEPMIASDREALVEEVLYIEDDLDEDPALEESSLEPPAAATDAASPAKSAARARAREAARVFTTKARVRRALGDVTGAEKLFEDALEALPTYGPAAADLATLQIHRGDYRSALAYAKRAARSAPRKLSYMVLLGDAYQLIGNRGAAEVQWRRAAEYGSAKAEERLAKHVR